jgi:hypothetical protein
MASSSTELELLMGIKKAGPADHMILRQRGHLDMFQDPPLSDPLSRGVRRYRGVIQVKQINEDWSISSARNCPLYCIYIKYSCEG